MRLVQVGLRSMWWCLLVSACLVFSGLSNAARGADDPVGGEHAAEGDHHGAEHGDPQPLVVDPDLAIFTAIVFLLLLAILAKFAWKPIMAALAQREESIASDIDAAKKSHQEAQALLAQYEQKLASSADEVRQIIEEARRDAEHTREQIVAEAKEAAATERQRALREIETATDQSLAHLSQASADLAVQLAGKIVRAQLNPEDHSNLVREAMEQFSQAKPSDN